MMYAHSARGGSGPPTMAHEADHGPRTRMRQACAAPRLRRTQGVLKPSSVRSAETPAYLLLVMDLWDRSARSLLDDHSQTLKVESYPPRPGMQPPRLQAPYPPICFGPQVSDVLYILRDVATGLSVVHAHKARPTFFSLFCLAP
jgi:hypothetical protein